MHLYLAALFAVAPAGADVSHPLAEMLRSLPEVESVVEYRAARHHGVIIHLRDWHYVDFVSFEADLRDSDPDMTDSELRRAYLDHLRQVQAVQAEQRQVIRRLTSAGVRTVYLEGLTPDIEPVFPLICRTVCTENEPPRSQLFELPNRLAMRSAGQLLAAGEPLTIRAADSDETLAACNPIDKSGEYRDVPARAIEQREDHMIKAASRLPGEAVLLLLGGGHDLRDNMSAVGTGQFGLIVVATHQYVAVSQTRQ